jgi:hypothetical protein
MLSIVITVVGVVVAIAIPAGSWIAAHNDAEAALRWAQVDICYNHPVISASQFSPQ